MRLRRRRIAHTEELVTAFSAAQADVSSEPDLVTAPERQTETETLPYVAEIEVAGLVGYFSGIVKGQQSE